MKIAELVTVPEAARMLGISKQAGYPAIRQGNLLPVMVPGRQALRRSDLERYKPMLSRQESGRRSWATKRLRVNPTAYGTWLGFCLKGAKRQLQICLRTFRHYLLLSPYLKPVQRLHRCSLHRCSEDTRAKRTAVQNLHQCNPSTSTLNQRTII